MTILVLFGSNKDTSLANFSSKCFDSVLNKRKFFALSFASLTTNCFRVGWRSLMVVKGFGKHKHLIKIWHHDSVAIIQ